MDCPDFDADLLAFCWHDRASLRRTRRLGPAASEFHAPAELPVLVLAHLLSALLDDTRHEAQKEDAEAQAPEAPPAHEIRSPPVLSGASVARRHGHANRGQEGPHQSPDNPYDLHRRYPPASHAQPGIRLFQRREVHVPESHRRRSYGLSGL